MKEELIPMNDLQNYMNDHMQAYAKSRLIKLLLKSNRVHNILIPNLMTSPKDSRIIDKINNERSRKYNHYIHEHDWKNDNEYQYYMKYSYNNICNNFSQLPTYHEYYYWQRVRNSKHPILNLLKSL